MIHNANNLREKRDGLKVGGHQASSTSLATVLTALYFKQMLPQDRTAVKPHASPLFHSLQYLAGRQSVEQLQRFRAFGGVQSYPSRTKDSVDVDFSTGSVGLGAAVTTFAALIQDYLDGKGLTPAESLSAGGRLGKMIALVGDAELDEGNVYEALLESAKLGVRNNWWIVDYNRQSLDKVADDKGAYLIDKMFRANGWRVVTLKYGKKMSAAFEQEGGRHVKQWLNKSDNTMYSALCFQGGKHFRKQLKKDLADVPGVEHWLASYDDDALFEVMTDLGGHCMETVLEGLDYAQRESERTDENFVFICYTIKGYGARIRIRLFCRLHSATTSLLTPLVLVLSFPSSSSSSSPFPRPRPRPRPRSRPTGLQIQGHPDNHGLILNQKQIDHLQQQHAIAPGQEWDSWSGMDAATKALAQTAVENAPFFNDRTSPMAVAPIKGVRSLENAKGAAAVEVPLMMSMGAKGAKGTRYACALYTLHACMRYACALYTMHACMRYACALYTLHACMALDSMSYMPRMGCVCTTSTSTSYMPHVGCLCTTSTSYMPHVGCVCTTSTTSRSTIHLYTLSELIYLIKYAAASGPSLPKQPSGRSCLN
jgi:pyruvate dehydrogenase E1 component